ncbi:uncharacterized protein [Battus philenor]|uniref:uncharacterized protein n=1 Tax=Battus philenor TaxID=42288 RepID=UPI0035D03545
MKGFTITLSLICVIALYKSRVKAVNLPGPKVYVVTPSPRPLQNDEGRSAPFYYHNWMRRMDTGPTNMTTPSTTTTKKMKDTLKTPDLIFAEFEADSNGSMKKSIRQLLEKERVSVKSTTLQPIYVPDNMQIVPQETNYGLPIPNVKSADKENKETDYFEMYNKMYNNAPSPIYIPTTTPPTTTTKTTTSSTDIQMSNIENIWHIIDNEKSSQLSNNWQEVPVGANSDNLIKGEKQLKTDGSGKDDNNSHNFEIPGFAANPGNGAENESRAIRTESNLGFPYVNLKPFQVKTMQNPSKNSLSNSKGSNNLYTNIDNFYDLKNPVRGEAQDVIPKHQLIDRYNPAQPYLPHYGGNSKQTNSVPVKTTSNLVPPPPPPAPKLTDNDFPIPTNYESFPPYPPSIPDYSPPSSAPPKQSISVYSPPTLPMKPPAPSVQSYIPSLQTMSLPFEGYSYNKPSAPSEAPPALDMNDNEDFQGYHYDKPDLSPPADYAQPEDDKPDEPEDSGFPSDFPGDLKHNIDFDEHDFYHHHHPHTTTTTTEMPRVNRYSYYYLGKKLYYLPLYFSVYFIVYVGALIIKAVLRHKIVYPNSWRPNGTTAGFFSKRSIDSWNLSSENLHEVTGRVTHAIATAAKMYMKTKAKN